MVSEVKRINKNTDNSFNIWRILFTLVIMVFHLTEGSTIYEEYPMLSYHWYIAVEFFFVLSGYLLMLHVDKHPEESVGTYIKGRVTRLYPEYIIVFFMMVILRSIRNGLNPLKYIIPNWLEALMLQSIGTDKFPYLNNPAWYVSALLIGSYIVYYFLRNHRKAFTQIIGPLGIIVIFSYFYRKYGCLQGFIVTEGIWCNQAVLRALLGLTIGVFVYLAAQWCRDKYSERFSVLFVLIETVIFIGVPAVALFSSDYSYDFAYLFLFAVGIFCSSQDKILGKLSGTRVVTWLAEITYPMYMVHFFVILLINKYWDTTVWHWWHIPVYIVETVIVAAVLHFIAKKLVNAVSSIIK